MSGRTSNSGVAAAVASTTMVTGIPRSGGVSGLGAAVAVTGAVIMMTGMTEIRSVIRICTPQLHLLPAAEASTTMVTGIPRGGGVPGLQAAAAVVGAVVMITGMTEI